jgi:hypothetical protein
VVQPVLADPRVLVALLILADHFLQEDLRDRIDPECLDFRLVLKVQQVLMVLVVPLDLDLQQTQLDLEVL